MKMTWPMGLSKEDPAWPEGIGSCLRATGEPREGFEQRRDMVSSGHGHTPLRPSGGQPHT